MKCKICLKKLLPVSMALILSASMFMQGTLTATATEETTGNAIDNSSQEGEESNSQNIETESGSTGEGNKTNEMSDATTESNGEAVKSEAEVQQENTLEASGDSSNYSEARMTSAETDSNNENNAESENTSDLNAASVSDLKFENGVATFTVTSSELHYYTAGLYSDTSISSICAALYLGSFSSNTNNEPTADFRGYMNRNGNYWVKVKISDKLSDFDFDSGTVFESESFAYTLPTDSVASDKLPTPNLKFEWVNEESVARAEWDLVEGACDYFFALYKNGKSVKSISGDKTLAGKLDFNLNQFGEGSYTFRVHAISEDITKYANSDWSGPSNTLVWRGEESADQTEEKEGETVSMEEEAADEQPSDSIFEQAQPWEPTTPDEIRRYECVGKEAVDYTPSSKNTYPLAFMNAMQGPACFASFEAVLGDYTIGRTYNIYPAGNCTYSMEQEAEVTIKIPEAIYAPDRDYKMICVTKDGQPVILNDLDKNPDTVTVRTNKFYAFALIYK